MQSPAPSRERSAVSSAHDGLGSEHSGASSEHDGVSSEHNGASCERSAVSSEHSAPGQTERAALEALAAPLRSRRRASVDEVERVLMALCQDRFPTLPELADLTGRTVNTLRVHYIARLVTEGKLRLRYPSQPTHPGQSYTAGPAGPGEIPPPSAS